MTGAGGVTVVQAASVLASSSPKPTQLSLVAAVDCLGAPDAGLFDQSNLLQRSHMLGITLRLVPLMQYQHPGQRRQTVRQHPHGQASGGRREPR